MKRSLFAVACALLAVPCLRAQTADPAQLDSMIRRVVAEKHIVGLSVGVMQNGKVILAKGYGVRDASSRDPVTPRTMFAIGSVTKQFTCSALMLLVEQRRLALTDPVSMYLPTLTRAKEITLLDLGGHLSGYRDYYPLDFVDREMQKPATADQIITQYATRPLDFAPRSRYSYSNTGFLILGRIIEKVSGESFGAFIDKRIFAPLKLTRTVYEPATTPTAADMAQGYTSFGLADIIRAEPEARGWTGSAGAIWSTPADLMTWDLSLLDHTIITPASYAVLTTPQRLTDGRSSGYGCGESVNDRGLALVISHGGATSGFVAQNTVIPATRSAVVLLSNSDLSPIGELNQALIAKVMPRSPDVPVIAGLSAVEAARKFLSDLEKGTVDRSTLGADFSAFLTPEKVAAARRALNAMGPVSKLRLAGVRERGEMEVATVQFDLGSTTAVGLMYRSADGKVQEFLISRN
jgi:CubicO group peptidase (beta-lactamase class C family)